MFRKDWLNFTTHMGMELGWGEHSFSSALTRALARPGAPRALPRPPHPRPPLLTPRRP